MEACTSLPPLKMITQRDGIAVFRGSSAEYQGHLLRSGRLEGPVSRRSHCGRVPQITSAGILPTWPDRGQTTCAALCSERRPLAIDHFHGRLAPCVGCARRVCCWSPCLNRHRGKRQTRVSAAISCRAGRSCRRSSLGATNSNGVEETKSD